MIYFIHCNRHSFQCLHTRMSTVSFCIAHDDLSDCRAHHNITRKGQVKVNHNVKDQHSSENRKHRASLAKTENILASPYQANQQGQTCRRHP